MGSGFSGLNPHPTRTRDRLEFLPPPPHQTHLSPPQSRPIRVGLGRGPDLSGEIAIPNPGIQFEFKIWLSAINSEFYFISFMCSCYEDIGSV